MKVWVTGARGMLGREIGAELDRRGVAWAGTDAEVDIADPAAVAAQLAETTATHVINCAAYTRVDDAEQDRAAAFRTNAVGPEVLGRAALASGAVLVHVSTDYVFGGGGERPHVETDTPAPRGVYAESKWEGEMRLAALAAPRLGYVVRTSWLFGAGGNNFVTTILDRMVSQAEIRVVDDQRGRPTYAPDLARAALDLAGVGRPEGAAPTGTYHFANGGEASWFELACRVRERALALGWTLRAAAVDPIPTAALPRPAPRPAYSVLDTTRITRALGRPPRHWHDALDEYLVLLRTPRSADRTP
jgi:dTDP-4-dehydrorhamnose reductase